MKKNVFVVILVLLFSGCTAENNFSPEPYVITKGTSGQKPQIELSSVASILTMIDMDSDLVNEVKQIVDRSIYYGQNETCRFKDLFMPDSSKIFRSRYGLLILKLEQTFNSYQWSFSRDELVDYLSNGNIQIYWPYSKSWDSVTLPVITYDSGDERDWNYGYKRIERADGTVAIDTIIVDSDYMKSNPVWIINRNKIPYEELPDFENGEYINKYGTLFFSDAYKKNQKKAKNFGFAGQSVYIGYIHCLNTLDGIWGGGA